MRYANPTLRHVTRELRETSKELEMEYVKNMCKMREHLKSNHRYDYNLEKNTHSIRDKKPLTASSTSFAVHESSSNLSVQNPHTYASSSHSVSGRNLRRASHPPARSYTVEDLCPPKNPILDEQMRQKNAWKPNYATRVSGPFVHRLTQRKSLPQPASECAMNKLRVYSRPVNPSDSQVSEVMSKVRSSQAAHSESTVRGSSKEYKGPLLSFPRTASCSSSLSQIQESVSSWTQHKRQQKLRNDLRNQISSNSRHVANQSALSRSRDTTSLHRVPETSHSASEMMFIREEVESDCGGDEDGRSEASSITAIISIGSTTSISRSPGVVPLQEPSHLEMKRYKPLHNENDIEHESNDMDDSWVKHMCLWKARHRERISQLYDKFGLPCPTTNDSGQDAHYRTASNRGYIQQRSPTSKRDDLSPSVQRKMKVIPLRTTGTHNWERPPTQSLFRGSKKSSALHRTHHRRSVQSSDSSTSKSSCGTSPSPQMCAYDIEAPLDRRRNEESRPSVWHWRREAFTSSSNSPKAGSIFASQNRHSTSIPSTAATENSSKAREKGSPVRLRRSEAAPRGTSAQNQPETRRRRDISSPLWTSSSEGRTITSSETRMVPPTYQGDRDSITSHTPCSSLSRRSSASLCSPLDDPFPTPSQADSIRPLNNRTPNSQSHPIDGYAIPLKKNHPIPHGTVSCHRSVSQKHRDVLFELLRVHMELHRRDPREPLHRRRVLQVYREARVLFENEWNPRLLRTVRRRKGQELPLSSSWNRARVRGVKSSSSSSTSRSESAGSSNFRAESGTTPPERLLDEASLFLEHFKNTRKKMEWREPREMKYS